MDPWGAAAPVHTTPAPVLEDATPNDEAGDELSAADDVDGHSRHAFKKRPLPRRTPQFES